MIFHVRILVRLPHDMPVEQVQELRSRELEVAQGFRKQGKILNLWRIAGRFGTHVIFDVADPDELHALLTSLPLFPFADIEVTSLARHPLTI
jgi:muconolactone D-isomerase